MGQSAGDHVVRKGVAAENKVLCCRKVEIIHTEKKVSDHSMGFVKLRKGTGVN